MNNSKIDNRARGLEIFLKRLKTLTLAGNHIPG